MPFTKHTRILSEFSAITHTQLLKIQVHLCTVTLMFKAPNTHSNEQNFELLSPCPILFPDLQMNHDVLAINITLIPLSVKGTGSIQCTALIAYDLTLFSNLMEEHISTCSHTDTTSER